MLKFYKSKFVTIVTISDDWTKKLEIVSVQILDHTASIQTFDVRKYHAFKRRLKSKFNHVKTWLNPFPVYFINDGMDCDCVRTTRACRSKNGYTFLKDCEAIYEGAEGPEHIQVVSRKEYEDHTTQTRDLALEAFEDGHPHNVYY
jgi:hypothetical protein